MDTTICNNQLNTLLWTPWTWFAGPFKPMVEGSSPSRPTIIEETPLKVGRFLVLFLAQIQAVACGDGWENVTYALVAPRQHGYTAARTHDQY